MLFINLKQLCNDLIPSLGSYSKWRGREAWDGSRARMMPQRLQVLFPGVLKGSTSQSSGSSVGVTVPGCLVHHPGDCWGAHLTLLLFCMFFPHLFLDAAGWEMWNTEGGGDPSFKRLGVVLPASRTWTEGTLPGWLTLTTLSDFIGLSVKHPWHYSNELFASAGGSLVTLVKCPRYHQKVNCLNFICVCQENMFKSHCPRL